MQWQTQLSSGVTRIVPLKIDDCEVPWFLREKRHVDFREWNSENKFRVTLQKMVESLGPINSIKCCKTGMILRLIGNRVAFSPPLIINEKQIEELFERVRSALAEFS